MSKRVIVVGGGVSGLALAYEMRRRNPAAGVTVLEKGPRVGGKIRTERDRGFVIEAGPDAFLRTYPAAVELCRELGLGNDLIPTNPTDASVYILSGGTLHPLPDGLRLVVPTDMGALRKSALFSRRGQLRIALEPWIPRRKGTDDESLGSLLGRRFGRELVDRLAQPLLGGIYGGDIDRLGVGATFPDLARMESESGSLVRAARARPAPDTQSGGPFVSLKGGTQQLVDALIGALGDDVVRTNQRVVGLGTRSGATGTAHAVTTEDGAVMDCDDVVLAIPAPAAVALVHGVAPHVARALAGLAHASTAVVSLGFREGDVGRALDGYGFLVAKDEATPIRGCTWSSTKFPGRAPAGHVLVRAFVGGSGREGEVALDEGALVAAALEALRPLLDLRGAPVMTQVARWPAAQPQYETGHKDRVAHIRSALPAGVHLLGASYDGVGVPACVDAGRKLGTALSVETTGPPLD